MKMRVFKSAGELKLMRRAAEVSANAHVKAMQACKPGLYEYQIEAEIIYHFVQNGLRAVAYPSIVAGGKNACTLHYTENASRLESGDLLLIDAGAERRSLCRRYYAHFSYFRAIQRAAKTTLPAGFRSPGCGT